MQVAHVTDVQKIEAPVRQSDPLAGAAPFFRTLAQRGTVDDLRFCRCVQ
jgi:hypothetical protein